MTELFSDLPGQRRATRRHAHRARRPGGATRFVVLFLAAALVLGAMYLGWRTVKPMYDDWRAPSDFAGPGSGEVHVQVLAGDSGSQVAQTLVDKNVIKTTDAFIEASMANPDSNSLQPGTYALRAEMAAADALAMLLDETNRVSVRVVIPEGLRAQQIYRRISEATGLGVDELKAAVTDPAVGLPPQAQGNPEGYLFPATYEFEPDESATTVLKRLVDAHKRAVSTLGIAAEQEPQVLTKASIIQAEARSAADMRKVARVIQNRLDRGTSLQMDSTVHYATNNSEVVTTTQEERQIDSAYNTYKYPGLPPGPINSPGEDALRAATEPADGDWVYFVTVNPDTGETKFAATKAEHDRNVEEFRQWLRDND